MLCCYAAYSPVPLLKKAVWFLGVSGCSALCIASWDLSPIYLEPQSAKVPVFLFFLSSHKWLGFSLSYSFLHHHCMKIYHLFPLRSSSSMPTRSRTFSSALPFIVIPEVSPLTHPIEGFYHNWSKSNKGTNWEKYFLKYCFDLLFHNPWLVWVKFPQAPTFGMQFNTTPGNLYFPSQRGTEDITTGMNYFSCKKSV